MSPSPSWIGFPAMSQPGIMDLRIIKSWDNDGREIQPT